MISQRKVIDYSVRDTVLYNKYKRTVLDDIDIMLMENKIEIFDNQSRTAEAIVNNYKNLSVINQIVLGKTQSGKTGMMLATIKKLLESEIIIPAENIFVITGLSSLDWKRQTIDRFPIRIKDNIYHRSELGKSFYNNLKNKKNCLIILDECHVACKSEQTISKVFSTFGLLKLDYLLNNDIKILEFSATPDGTLYDLAHWNEHSVKVMAQPGLGYIGAIDLLNQNRLRQYQNLFYDIDKDTVVSDSDGTNDDLNEANKEQVLYNITELITTIQSFDSFRYHIIRTKTGQFHDTTVKLIKQVIGDIVPTDQADQFEFMCYDLKNINNINETLELEPTKHVIITIKEKLRCSHTIIKTYLGVLYERHVENYIDESTTIQGLIGRLCGYDCNADSICFTNISSIEKYEKLWELDFDRTAMIDVNWKSKTTKKSMTVPTFNYEFTANADAEAYPSNPKHEIEIIKKKTQPEIQLVFKQLKNDGVFSQNSYGPRNLICNKDGFYYSYYRGKVRILLKEEFSKDSKWAVSKTNNSNTNQYRYYSVYHNINDKESVEFWLIYFKT